MLPASTQPALRDLFRRYLDSRLEIYRLLPDVSAAKAELDRSTAMQQEIWNLATTACRTAEGRGVIMLVLPPLNQMFDITTTRTAALRQHPPMIIFGSLFFLALGCALLAGFGMAGSKVRSWAHMMGFAAIMSLAVYVIVDLEFPRLGLIRVDVMDMVLQDLRKQMK